MSLQGQLPRHSHETNNSSNYSTNSSSPLEPSHAPRSPSTPTPITHPLASNHTQQITHSSPTLYVTDHSTLQANQPWGHPLCQKLPQSTRISFHNINGIKSSHTASHCQELSQYMHTLQTDIHGLAETNINWSLPNVTAQCKSNLTKHWTHSHLITSHIHAPNQAKYQPGGVATLTSNKLIGRLISTHADHLGRWTATTYQGKHSHPVTIVTAYAVHKTAQGINTTVQQQWRAHRASGIDNPCPRTLFYNDLATFILTKQQQSEELILMIDANGTITKDRDLQQLCQRTNLIDTYQYLHPAPDTPINTYQRGTDTIDYIFATHEILQYVTQAGMDSFSISDHRALFIDVQLQDYFNMNITPSQRPQRHISTQHPQQIVRYMQHLDTILFPTIEAIATATPAQLDKYDTELTAALLDAEKQCKFVPNIPWSRQLLKARRIVSYWKLWLKQIYNNVDTHDLRTKLATEWNLSHYYAVTTSQAKAHLQDAYANLRYVRKHADQYRQQFLLEQAEWYAQTNNQSAATIVKQILAKEQSQQTYRRIRQLVKPNQNSQLTHILQYSNNEWQPVTDPDNIESLLLHRNHQHYQQSNGTPFTSPNVTNHIGCDGQHAMHTILNDSPPAMVEHNTAQMLLHQLHSYRLDPIQSTVQTDDLIAGFKRWREATATSPSGRHLGHYKVLALMSNSSTTATNILNVITAILNRAIATTTVITRWKTIHCLMLEKIPGSPRLDKLRVIQLFEADLNFVYGIMWGRRLTANAEKYKALGNEQWGSRKQRCAIDVAMTKQYTYDNISLDKCDAATMDNDAKSCYDRIVISVANLRGIQLGLPLLVAVHFFTFLQQAKYHVLTANGASLQHYQYTAHNAIHGPGQGSRAAPAIWLFVSTLLLECFRTVPHKLTIRHPTSTITHERQVDFYVDDATLWTNTYTGENVVANLAHMMQRWEHYLNASGGRLELSKCFFYVCKWNPDSYGRLHLDNTYKAQINIRDSTTNVTSAIEQKPCNIAHRTLGVRLAPDNNWKSELQALASKTTHFYKSLIGQQCTRKLILTLIQSVYLPSITYSLTVTCIKKQPLRKIQSKLDQLLLQQLHYNKHTPLALRYAPLNIGGAGIPCLYNMQGAQKLLYVVHHTSIQTPMTKLLRLTLDKFQFVAGCTTNILETPSNTDYSYTGCQWFTSLHTFLYSSHLSVSIQEVYTAQPLRESDRAIMDIAIEYQANLSLINICRIYLQAITLADISTTCGTAITTDAWHGTCRQEISTYNWPAQPRPSTLAWTQWRKLLSHVTTHRKLDVTLGPWTKDTHIQYSHVYCHNTKRVTNNVTHTQYTVTPRRRTMSLYPTSDFVSPTMTVPVHLTPAVTIATPAPRNPTNDVVISWDTSYTIQQDPALPPAAIYATDGSYYPNTNNGSFSWIGYREDNPATISTGNVPGTHMDAFRCEAFALYALCRYITDQQLTTYTIYTDCKLLIDRLKHPHTPFKDHHDLIYAIHLLRPTLQSIQYTPAHTAPTLSACSTIPQKANFLAHRHAQAAQTLPPSLHRIPATTVKHYKEALHTHLRHTITSANVTIQYQQYLTERWHLKEVDWQTFFTAAKLFPAKQFLGKLVSGWLPTAHNLHKYNHHHSPLCEVCHEHEDMLHLYRCQTNCTEYIQSVTTTLATLHTSQAQSTLCIQAVTDWITHSDIDSKIIPVPLGFLPYTWQSHNPHRWTVKFVIALWNEIHRLWTRRNDRVHSISEEHANATIRLLYDRRTALSRSDQQHLFTETIQSLLSQPLSIKQNWINTTKTIVNHLAHTSILPTSQASIETPPTPHHSLSLLPPR